MSESRVYLDAPLETGASLELPEGAFRHLIQVLRMQAGERLVVFNGQGSEYEAVLETVAKRAASLRVGAFRPVKRESPLHLSLIQGISKGERMDYSIQKAVELGVTRIVPVITERCNVSLDRERQDKKLDHWRGVMISACEQSGRCELPQLLPVIKLADWLASEPTGLRLMLDPSAADTLAGLDVAAQPISLIIGPEGGLSPAELRLGAQHGARGARLGPRILRTETAGVVAISILQSRFGDLKD